MPRLIKTGPIPTLPDIISDDGELVAPNAEIGRRFGRPARSIYQIAKDALKRSGFGVATPITAATILRSAVRDVVGGGDPSAVARHYRESVAAILRSAIDTAAMKKHGSDRSQTAAEITNAYRSSLDKLRLVDRDAVLTEAVRHGVIEPRSVLIYGYFRARQLPARAEEIEFIDSLAADGSTLYLPCGDELMFSSNRAWRDLLLERGWEVDDDNAVLDRPANNIEEL